MHNYKWHQFEPKTPFLLDGIGLQNLRNIPDVLSLSRRTELYNYFWYRTSCIPLWLIYFELCVLNYPLLEAKRKIVSFLQIRNLQYHCHTLYLFVLKWNWRVMCNFPIVIWRQLMIFVHYDIWKLKPLLFKYKGRDTWTHCCVLDYSYCFRENFFPLYEIDTKAKCTRYLYFIYCIESFIHLSMKLLYWMTHRALSGRLISPFYIASGTQ